VVYSRSLFWCFVHCLFIGLFIVLFIGVVGAVFINSGGV
jgi:hypothetical protein